MEDPCMKDINVLLVKFRYMYSNINDNLPKIKNLNNDSEIIEIVLKHIHYQISFIREQIFSGLCHYIFFSNNNLIKTYIDKLKEIAKKYSYDMFKNYKNMHSISFLIPLDYDNFYQLISNGFPIPFWYLHIINDHHKLDFLDEIIIDDNNYSMFIPQQNIFSSYYNIFSIKTNKYGSIYFQTYEPFEISKLDCLKLIKINYSSKIKKIIADYIFKHKNHVLYDFFKEKLVDENLLKYINKNNSEFYVNIILEKYPNVKFDLTKNSYSKLSFEKIIKNKNFIDNDPIFLKNIDNYIYSEIVFNYIQVPSLCFMSNKIINEYYLIKKITNDEFIDCLHKLFRKNIKYCTHIQRVLSKDQNLFTFENIEFLFTKFWNKNLDNYYIFQFVEYFIESLNKLLPIEKDKILFILAKKYFSLFCKLVFNVENPKIKDYENYDENKGWKFNEEHIIISCFGNPLKTKFLNFIKFCLKHNKISKYDELYVALKNNNNKECIDLIQNKISNDIIDLYNKQKVYLYTDNFSCELVII